MHGSARCGWGTRYRCPSDVAEWGADIAASCDFGTALHVAARRGGAMAIATLLECGADIVAGEGVQGTALHDAARGGHIAAIRILLEGGADIEAQNNSGETALHTAAGHRETNAIRTLLEGGADIEARDNSGETALHVAVLYGFQKSEPAVVQALLERGADTEPGTETGTRRYSELSPIGFRQARLLRSFKH